MGVTTTDEEVALISRRAYAHVILNGSYFFRHFLLVEPIVDVLKGSHTNCQFLCLGHPKRATETEGAGKCALRIDAQTKHCHSMLSWSFVGLRKFEIGSGEASLRVWKL